MKKSPVRRIAFATGLALTLTSVGASHAATRRPTKVARPTTTVSKAKNAVTATPPARSIPASLVLSGFISGTLTEVRLSTQRCHPAGAVTSGGFEFDGPKSSYVLSFSLPIGATTFPSANKQAYLSFVDLADQSTYWVIGPHAPTVGTATFDGAQGTIDAAMIPDPPSPAKTRILLKGSFSCAYGPS